ncbi:exonuclease mut-7 homolog isoform X2 [Cynara cardunculus var. scolymus]|uniref:exonuclease mut-7 homolog isoform X2 n=1 Tax=Cynara cardunculus var. scolymus TaxID=59895 RepID=UPI000D62DE64|nr:exonuclease mut-7 homolog isoform X2 [Cynara cardunculus var. scolymus]
MDPSDGIHFVSSTDSPEFTRLSSSLTRSSVIGLDAEWKPVRAHQPNFPTVLLLQIACRLDSHRSIVFLLDLSEILLPSVYHLLRDVFLSPHILKLGFRFKQDLLYLSSTFRSQGCDSGFDRVEPFLDIATIYSHLHHKQTTRKTKVTKSLSFICEELLGMSLSKELQCSDWSLRPLTKDQRTYAAIDALCLIEIFNVFQLRVLKEGAFRNLTELDNSSLNLGLKQILKEPNISSRILRTTFCDAVEMIVRGYSDKIVLTESDGKPGTSKKKGKRKSSTGFTCKEKRVDDIDEWRGPAPWDYLLGGDGFPKFLCDVMVEGLAKHLRCVGIDAAVPYSRKPETRELIDQAIKEKRVLLTRDAKLLRHEYLLGNQIYRVKSLLKNDQLIEVIETFQLKICEDQLMSRCTKCNGRFIQKPLSIEEAIEAAKGFQVIPNCLFDRNIEFWQCTDCNQLYWEGTQYHNAVQKFIDVCKISSA